MRKFERPLPEEGFYVVLATFQTDNMRFIPGEPVALIPMHDSPYVHIVKTGKRFGGYANFMEVEFLPKLKRITLEEVSRLTDDYPVTEETLRSRERIHDACRAIIRSVTTLQKTLRGHRTRAKVLVKLPEGEEREAWLLFGIKKNEIPIGDRVFLHPLGAFNTDEVHLLDVLPWQEPP